MQSSLPAGAFAMWLAVAPAFAAPDLSGQSSQTLKVYVDPVKKTVFWPARKPLWIKIAEGPDADAASYALGSAARISSGISVASSGPQSLKWRDAATGDTATMRFVVDGEEPVCSIKLRAPASVQVGSKTWYGAGCTGTIAASDRLSGVDAMLVSEDGSPSTLVQSPQLTFDREKTYRVSCFALDRVGNASKVETAEFGVDLSPPVTRLAGTAADTMFSPKKALRFAAADSLSGVAQTFGAIDGGEKLAPVSGSTPLAGLKEGRHAVSFYSTDRVGNKEQRKNVAFYVDNTGPQTTVAVEGDSHSANGRLFVAPSSVVRVDARDAMSGVDKVQTSINGGAPVTYERPLKLDGVASGPVRVTATSVDRAGNAGTPVAKAFEMDADAPVTQIAFQGAALKQAGATCITSRTKIALTAQDNLSGVKAVEWVDADGKSVAYKEPFTLAREGAFGLRFHAVDNVGNGEADKQVQVVVDNTPPEISKTFSRRPTAADEARGTYEFSAPVTLFLGASDAISGANGIYHAINGAKEARYREEIALAAPGTYTIKIRAVDNVGIAKEESVVVKAK